MDIEFDNALVHLRRTRKANGAALKPLDVCAKVQVAALNALRPAFANVMTHRVKALTVAFPVIGVKVLHLAACQFFHQTATTAVSAPSQFKCGNAPGAPIAR